MKQIKTIMNRADAWKQFDADVNNAIAEGWTLVKRDVLRPFEGQTYVFHRMLYAELERGGSEDEHCCDTCKHFDKPEGVEPCTVCCHGVPTYPNKWEPEE